MQQYSIAAGAGYGVVHKGALACIAAVSAAQRLAAETAAVREEALRWLPAQRSPADE